MSNSGSGFLGDSGTYIVNPSSVGPMIFLRLFRGGAPHLKFLNPVGGSPVPATAIATKKRNMTMEGQRIFMGFPLCKPLHSKTQEASREERRIETALSS